MEKIEFIKKAEPSKFRAIVNVSESHNVGVVLSRAELKAVFFNIKNLLEENVELKEKAESTRKEVVVQEVELTLDKAIDFIKNNNPSLLRDSDEDVVVVLEDEDDHVIDVNKIQEPEKKKRGGLFGFLGLSLIFGVAITGLTYSDAFNKIVSMLGI